MIGSMLFSEAKRKTGKVHTVDSGSTMRKEVLKAAKSRHKSAGRATEGNNNSSERTNSEEEFAEVFTDSTTAAGMLCFYPSQPGMEFGGNFFAVRGSLKLMTTVPSFFFNHFAVLLMMANKNKAKRSAK